MKIPAIGYTYNFTPKKSQQSSKNSPAYTSNSTELRPRFNDHLLAFGARVDKDMNRFYNVNKDRMPITVRELVEPMPNRALITPLEAQYYAFQKLDSDEIKSAEDIKKAYPNEPLFDDLKDLSEIKPSKGLLHAIKEMEEIFPDGILQSKEDITVYLVKKLFLEAKTLDEVNKDLEEDMLPDFKIYCKGEKTKDKLVLNSTLGALGIHLPDKDYLTSLRYTRDGYSDMMGVKISKGLEKFINSLTPEQRTARAIRSTRQFEKWWNKLTREEKIEMIANKESEIEMLKAFRREKRAELKRLKEAGIEISDEEIESGEKIPKTHTKVGSKELKQDELFKLWATLNIKQFEASLSQAEMDTLHLRRMANLFMRWNKMTPAERTEYISKMKAGAEPIRYTMIDAWNNSPEIIKALYLHLKENQVYKPADLLYSTDEFSQFQSKVMNEFWDNNPKFSELLGDRIHQSRNKVELAIRRGNFEELKNQINRNKNERKRELEAYKKSLEKPVIEEKPTEPADYKAEFRQAYAQSIFGMIQSTPKNFFSDVYEHGLDTLPENIVRLWTRVLKNDNTLTNAELRMVKEALNHTNTPEIMKYNHAFETAIADALYTATKNPIVFGLNTTHLKSAIYQLERGENPIRIVDETGNNNDLILKIDNKFKRIDTFRINQIYETYKRDLTEDELTEIIRYNFSFNVDDNENLDSKKSKVSALQFGLVEYLKIYGRSVNILFSDKSVYPSNVKKAFAQKFFANMPASLRNSEILNCTRMTDKDIDDDMHIKHAKNLYTARFAFLPKEVINSYFKELNPIIITLAKADGSFSVQNVLIKICKKRIRPSDHGSILPMPKHLIKDKYIKYQMLAIEQAMADVLYESCQDENVYKIGFEALCDKLELFSMAKSFPVEKSACPTVDGAATELVAKKRLNMTSIQKRYKEYMEEISEWVDETKDVHKPNLQDLLYILNPEENNTQRDFNVAERIATYFPDFSELDFKSNPYGPEIKIINEKQKPAEK